MSPAIKLLYVRYQLPDLDKARSFLLDFGMVTAHETGEQLFMRGSGTAPYLYSAVKGPDAKFLGAGFLVDSLGQLERLATMPGSGPIENIDDAPGGGRRVRMVMEDGFEIDAVHGPALANPLKVRETITLNTARLKPRSNQVVRISRSPSIVNKLGHFVLHVRNHKAAISWLQERLGLIASDYLGPPGDPDQAAGTFLRFDRGEELVDHHCLLVLTAEKPAVHHCSYEVEDIDAVMSGHEHLKDCGYTLDCGVGRHLLGSQIFDYWRDPFGFRIEHYTDGDMVNHLHQATIFSGSADETTQWGAKPPKDFFE